VGPSPEVRANDRWRDSLRHASSLYEPSGEKGLIRLLPGLMGMVGENMDLLVTSLDLLDSYLLLDAPGILPVSRPPPIRADDRITARRSALPCTKP